MSVRANHKLVELKQLAAAECLYLYSTYKHYVNVQYAIHIDNATFLWFTACITWRRNLEINVDDAEMLILAC